MIEVRLLKYISTHEYFVLKITGFVYSFWFGVSFSIRYVKCAKMIGDVVSTYNYVVVKDNTAYFVERSK